MPVLFFSCPPWSGFQHWLYCSDCFARGRGQRCDKATLYYVTPACNSTAKLVSRGLRAESNIEGTDASDCIIVTYHCEKESAQLLQLPLQVLLQSSSVENMIACTALHTLLALKNSLKLTVGIIGYRVVSK